MRFFRFLPIAFVLAACATDADVEDEGESSSALDAGVVVETDFAQPAAGASDPTILNRMTTMINTVPNGASVHVALHSIDKDNAVYGALVAAKRPARGLDLEVVQNGEATNAGARGLAAALGTSYRQCGDANSGGCSSHAASSIMHSKLVLLSKAYDKQGTLHSNVVWFGSANMTDKTGASTWNNGVTVYGDKALYDQLQSKYFAKLWANVVSAGERVFTSEASGVSVHVSPDDQTDIVAARLAAITPSPGCSVRISQNMIHKNRTPILDQLRRVARTCDVRILQNHGAETVPLLDAMSAKVRYSHTHDKLFLVDAKFHGSESRRQLVFTGSHNWTSSANDLNDEILARVENKVSWRRFDAYFEAQWAASTSKANITGGDDD